MKYGRWIWVNNKNEVDTYAEFATSFIVKKDALYRIHIASSSYYCLFVNQNAISFTHCSDYPDYKYFNEIILNQHLHLGKNEIVIQVWHEGLDTQRAIREKPGLIFEIYEDNKVINYSNRNTEARIMNEYQNGYCKLITLQLGYSFLFDNTVKPNLFKKAIEVEKNPILVKRPIEELVLCGQEKITVIKIEDGYLIDLLRERAGFIELDFTCKQKELITIAYGEHLIDGNVRRRIEARDFSVEFIAKKGHNHYINHFRRLAGRYLQLVTTQDLEINFIGIRDVLYPVEIISKDFGNDLYNKIYDVSVRTLQLCMHEHYEDTPWREQCLYTMDSLNQIRCGYDCFKNLNLDYVRFNLELIARSVRKDGLLSICAPSGLDFPIPSFSLAYLIEVTQYLEQTDDLEFRDQVAETIKSITDVFIKRMDETSLIKEFGSPYWDFYEWTNYCDGEQAKQKLHYSAILNGMFIYAVRMTKKYFDIDIDLNLMQNQLKNRCFANDILYLNEDKQHASQLSCALAILIGIGDERTAEAIMKDTSLIQTTLSMKAFVYDALLSFEHEIYKKFVLDEITNNYSTMLNDGATSFYEVIEGASAFNNAGSLCHGWSAIPIIYLNKLL
ncbi:MAG: hypothetical protein ACOX3K_05595 [Bacilli bacterium]